MNNFYQGKANHMIGRRRKVALLLVAAAGIAAISAVHYYYAHDVQREQRADLEYTATILTDGVSGRIRAMVHATEIMAAFLTAENSPPNADAFDRYARELHSMHSELRALQLVDRDGIIVHQFPMKGNEEALGLDLSQLVDWEYLQQAKESGKTVICPNPGPLVQGTIGTVVRTPLFRNDSFLGWAQGVYDVKNLLHSTQHGKLDRYVSQLIDAEGNVLLGPDSMPEGAIGAPIKADGQTWQLRAVCQETCRVTDPSVTPI